MIVDGNIQGKIIYIGEEQTVGKNNLRKRTFVVEENSDKEYKSSLAIDLIKDRVEMINEFSTGDTVSVAVNFRASEYNDRYYNSITAWRITKADGSVTGGSSSSDEDDLPF